MVGQENKSQGRYFPTCSNHGRWHRQYPRSRHLAGEEDGRHAHSQSLLLHVGAIVELVSFEASLAGANTFR